MESNIRRHISQALVSECEETREHLNSFIGLSKQLLNNLDCNTDDLVQLHNNFIEMATKLSEVQDSYRKQIDHRLANHKLSRLVRFNETVRVKSFSTEDS